jgi:hypothetical protein
VSTAIPVSRASGGTGSSDRESTTQGLGLHGGQAIHAVQHRPQQLVQPGERQVLLRLPAGRRQDPHPRRPGPPRRLGQQDGLAHARIAQEQQHPAFRIRRGHQIPQPGQFLLPADQARVLVGHPGERQPSPANIGTISGDTGYRCRGMSCDEEFQRGAVNMRIPQVLRQMIMACDVVLLMSEEGIHMPTTTASTPACRTSWSGPRTASTTRTATRPGGQRCAAGPFPALSREPRQLGSRADRRAWPRTAVSITFDNAGVGGSTGTTPDSVEQMAARRPKESAAGSRTAGTRRRSSRAPSATPKTSPGEYLDVLLRPDPSSSRQAGQEATQRNVRPDRGPGTRRQPGRLVKRNIDAVCAWIREEWITGRILPTCGGPDPAGPGEDLPGFGARVPVPASRGVCPDVEAFLSQPR